jgi:hypothetical protein
MKNVLLKVITIAAMPIVGMSAAHALTTAGPNHPAGVPPGYVITPFGYFDPSCVVHLTEGDELRPDEHIIRHANGTSDKMPVCAHPHYRADGDKVMGDERGVKSPDISHSWIVSESVTNTSSFWFLSAEWSVPPTPPSNDGQTLFFFPGLEDSNDVVTIVQPVLGWNSDYKSAWGIASWNCCEKGTTYEATPQPVNSGDTILGYMYDTCAGGTLSCTSWDIVTWDLQNNKFSELYNTSNFKQTFNWAFGGVLEVYKIKQCSDYPNNPDGFNGGTHTTSFNDILLYNYKEQFVPNPPWSITNWANGLTPQCSYGASLPKQVILTY